MFNNGFNIQFYNSDIMLRYPFSTSFKNQIIEMIDDALSIDFSNFKVSNYTGFGDVFKDNIFNTLYNCFQNYLFPLGELNNEQDFLFCIFNINNPFKNLNNKLTVSFSIQYQYNIIYSNQNDLFLFPMTVFFITKTILSKIIEKESSLTSNLNIGYYLLPESLTSISDLNSIVYLLPDDVLLCSYCIYYIMSNMGFSDNLNNTLPTLIPIKTFDTIITIEINILSKIIYSSIVSILNSITGNNPFKYDIYSNTLNLNVIKNKPLITNKCVKCTDISKFRTFFYNPQIISCDMIIDLSNIIKISLNNFYWYDLFKQLNVTIFQTNVLFNDTYLIQLDNNLDILKSLMKIFYIRQDLIYVTKTATYLMLTNKLYAKPSNFISAKVLPGTQNIDYTQNYINTLSIFSNTNKDYYTLLLNNGKTKFTSNIYPIINYSLNFIKQYDDNTCSIIIKSINDSLQKLIYVYLLHKHILNSNIFNDIPTFAMNANRDLFTYALALDVIYQIPFSLFVADNKVIIWDPNKPDFDTLLYQIELLCSLQFKQLKDKNDLNKYCRCLYTLGSDLSPYCYDQGCKNWLNNENSIYIKYPCKYPTCSQSVDFTNLLSKTLNLNNITENISCGSYSNTNNILTGKYKLYFNDTNMYWTINDNNFITVSKNPSIFTFDYIGSTLIIRDIDIYNGYLIYKSRSYIPIITGLLSNYIYFIHKNFNAPIYTDNINILCQYKDTNKVNCKITMINHI